MRLPLALLLLAVVVVPVARASDALVGQEAPPLAIESWLAKPEGETLRDLRGNVVVLLLPGALDLSDAKAVTAWSDLRAGWWEKGLRVVALVAKAPEALPKEAEFSVAAGTAPEYGDGGRVCLVAADGKIAWRGAPDQVPEALIAKLIRKAKLFWLELRGPAAKTPAALVFKKGKLAEARTLAEAEQPSTDAAAYVIRRANELSTYWRYQTERAEAAGSLDEAVTCIKRVAKHCGSDTLAAEWAATALKALKSNKLTSKEATAADAYARLRQELARAGGKEKKLIALAKKAERAAKRKPVTRSVERAARLAERLRADPATAALKAFIAKERIKTTGSSWRNNLPRPPRVAFAKGKTYLWELETNQGAMTLRLFPDAAPMHVANAMYLSLLGFYDGLTFHRVIPGFMAQGGCPDGTGSGRIGYLLEGEFGGPGHDKAGMLSTANAGPGTDNSQFFITFRATKDLDGKHTVFGELIKGEATLEKIEKLGTKDGPTTKPVVIEKATVVVK